NGSDNRNHHMHLQWTTRTLSATGLGNKTREWDDRKTGPKQVEIFRKIVEQKTNKALELAGLDIHVDRRSYADLLASGDLDDGLLPTHHEGPAVTAARRRGKLLGVAEANDRKKAHNEALTEVRRTRKELRRAKADYAAIQLENRGSIKGSTPHDRRAAYAYAVRSRTWRSVYGATMTATLVDKVRYIDMGRDQEGRPARAVRLFLRGGGEVVDRGREVVGKTLDGNNQEIVAMLEIARARGWSTVTINGSDEFRAKATAAACEAGFSVAEDKIQTPKEQTPAQTPIPSKHGRKHLLQVVPMIGSKIKRLPFAELPTNMNEKIAARVHQRIDAVQPEALKADYKQIQRTGLRWRRSFTN
ncbi:MAG: LPD7 domain-containing protein, partial [Sedimenticola sp.]